MSIKNVKSLLFNEFARVSKALGSGNRLELLEFLAQGERSVDQLAKLSGLSVANTSRHLQVLRQAGLVAARKEGLFVFYSVSGEGVIWAIIGGTGTLFGPAIGTAVLIVLREELSMYWEHYLLVVGVIVILVVRYAPDGLIGLMERLFAGRDEQENAPDAAIVKGGRP